MSAYAEKVLPVEIPKTAVASASAAEFGTVYDITRYEGDARTYSRARDAYDRVSELLDQILTERWAAKCLGTESPRDGVACLTAKHEENVNGA